MGGSGAPQHMPPGLERGILHARFMLGDTTDGQRRPEMEPMRSAYLTLSVDSNEEAERIYTALTEGGEVLCRWASSFSRTLRPVAISLA